jgi:hypothetical protein
MAAVEVTLPLNGYWRPGKYTPVRVAAREAGPSVEINGEGFIPVRLPLRDGRFDGVIPLLIMSEPQGITGPPMRQLNPEQRIIGFTTIDIQVAKELFPGDTIIPIQLPPADPFPGPAIAWETLDAVVLDNTISNVTEEKLRELAACGVAIAWRPGEISKRTIIGPRFASDDLAPFAPVQGWAADWPPAFRRGILLGAIAFSIIALGVGLMRFRYSAIILILLCASATAGFWFFWKSRPTILTQCGSIIVRDGALAQHDLWIFQATASGSTSRMPFSNAMRPYFESKFDRIAMKPLLLCDESGAPQQFEYHLLAGQKIGFLMRSFIPTPEATLREPRNSPLERLAKRMYLRDGLTIAGESDSLLRLDLPKYGEQWPTLVLETTNR